MLVLVVLTSFLAVAFGSGSKDLQARYPHHVGIQYITNHVCNGAIITKYHVLTTANCTFGREISWLEVVVGAGDLKSQTKYSVSNITVHPLYFIHYDDYNVAVLRTRHRIRFNTNVLPVYITSFSLSDRETSVNVSSLMVDWKGDRLQETRVRTVFCWRTRESYYPQPSICAGYLNRTNTICESDEGAPMVRNGKLVGLLSHGRGCGYPNTISIFVDVPAVRRFLRTATREDV